MGTSLPMTAAAWSGGLELLLGLGRQAVDARGQDGLNRGGDLQALHGPGEPVGAALTCKGPRLHQRPHALFDRTVPRRGSLPGIEDTSLRAVSRNGEPGGLPPWDE